MPKLSSFPIATDPLGSGDYLIGTHTILGVVTDVKYSIDLLPSISLDNVLIAGNTSTNTITLTNNFSTNSLNLSYGTIRMYGTPGNKNAVISPFNIYVCSNGLNYGIQMTTSNDGSMNFLQFTQDGILGQIQATLLSGSPKVWQLPNQSGTFAMLSDVTGGTLQQVTTSGNTTSVGITCQLVTGATCSAQIMGDEGNAYIYCADAAGTAKITMGITTFGSDNGLTWTIPSYTAFLGIDTLTNTQSYLLPNRTGTLSLEKRGVEPQSVVVNGAAGTGATAVISTGSDDKSGQIVLTAGVGTVPGVVITVTMANNFLANTWPISGNLVDQAGTSTVAAGILITSVNTFEVIAVSSITAGHIYNFSYAIVG